MNLKDSIVTINFGKISKPINSRKKICQIKSKARIKRFTNIFTIIKRILLVLGTNIESNNAKLWISFPINKEIKTLSMI